MSIDTGKTPTYAAIATQLGVTRQTVWRFFACHPAFLAWLDDEMQSENNHLWNPLARRMFNLGMAASVAHADQFAKMMTGHYTRTLRGADTGEGAIPGDATVTQVFLIPRPEMPQAIVTDVAPLLPPLVPAGTVIPKLKLR